MSQLVSFGFIGTESGQLYRMGIKITFPFLLTVENSGVKALCVTVGSEKRCLCINN